MRIATVILFGLSTSLSLSAQPVTTQMLGGQAPGGVVYFLPKTVFHFHLLVERRTFTPGEFAPYAENYLRLRDVRQEREVSHNVIDVSITRSAVRDTSRCYTVKMKGGKCETAEVRCSEDGVLLAVNDEPLTIPVHVPFKAAQQPVMPDAHRFLSAEVMAAGSRAKMAELTARQMQELQERRQQLLTDDDETPKDERLVRRVIAEIDAEYQALLSLFTGTLHRDTVEHTVTLCPERYISREVFFRLSRQLGVVDKDDLAGVPYYISIEPISPAEAEKYSVPENKKNEGFYVCVPGSIRLSLFRADMPLASFDLSAAQFGFTELCHGNLFKRYVTHMQLHPATGAIVRLHADTDAK
ncbi:MAG: DUF4831 family protein [Prevotella sp.]|nr:DUF4831 family protein [Prevotella sp.]